jgi:hypothetical protein
MLFGKMKEMGVTSEFLSEQARLYIAVERLKRPNFRLTDEDQILILQKQCYLEAVLLNSLRESGGFVISDTSSLNALLYMERARWDEALVRAKIAGALQNSKVIFHCAPISSPEVRFDPNRLHGWEESRRIADLVPELFAHFGVKTAIPLEGGVNARATRAYQALNSALMSE